MKKYFYLCLLLVFIQGCSPSDDSRYNSGYKDGFEEGYNTTCKISAPLVKGDWDNKFYSEGYLAGQADGAASAVKCRL